MHGWLPGERPSAGGGALSDRFFSRWGSWHLGVMAAGAATATAWALSEDDGVALRRPGARAALGVLSLFRRELVGTAGAVAGDRRLAVACSVFSTIAALNLLALGPWGYAATAHPFLTCGLSFSFWAGSVCRGVLARGTDFLALWAPAGLPPVLAPLVVPVELASFCARAAVIGGRVAANLTAGHLLTGLAGIFALETGRPLFFWAVFPALFALEAGVAVVQAYVAVVLIAGTWQEAEGGDERSGGLPGDRPPAGGTGRKRGREGVPREKAGSTA